MLAIERFIYVWTFFNKNHYWWVLYISSLYYLASYSGYSWGESHPFVEMKSENSAAPSNWAIYSWTFFNKKRSWWVFLCPRRLSAWHTLLIAEPGIFSLLDSQWISTPWIFFWLRLVMGKPCLSFLFKLFWLKHVSSLIIDILLYISHGLQFSAIKNFMTDLSPSR